MSETSGRLLKLLSLLQTPREWPGPELAGRLQVSTRTVRNDIDRLRTLGYPVEATRGSIGGYRLVAGTAMPPLLLDDEEAVAVAVSLRTSAGGAVVGIEETALQALTKLQQVLPPHLARRVDAIGSFTVRVGAGGPGRQGPTLDGAALGVMTAAARDRELVRFAYSDASGAATERRAEPYRVVNWGRRWYLVAFDVERDDWRTFRVDRISELRSVGHRFTLRPLPADDVADWVARKTRSASQPFRATVLVDAPAETVTQRIGGWAEGGVEALPDGRCRLTMGARSARDLAIWLGFLDADFTVHDSPELAAALAGLGTRLLAAATPDRLPRRVGRESPPDDDQLAEGGGRMGV